MADIFDEVSEDLRAERAQRLAGRYGAYVVALAGLIVVAVAGYEVWRQQQVKRDAALATQYIAALQPPTSAAKGSAGESSSRQAALMSLDKLAGEAPSGYATLARLRAAALKADGGDVAGAAALWDQVANDRGADPLLRDFANLTWASRQLDSADPAAIRSRLQPLRAADSPWHALADEMDALLDLRVGRTDDARETLRKLTQDTTAPETTRSRANFLLGRLGE